MNKYKVREFVEAYSRALEIDNSTESILLELMEKIITKYEKIVSNIPVKEDKSKIYFIKPQNGYYTVEDFFLNRLMRNVWFVKVITKSEIEEGFASIHTKGQYLPGMLTVEINPEKLENQLLTYKDIMLNRYHDIKFRAHKKVIMHEFEHALQTRFVDELDFRFCDSYRRISDEIRKIDTKKYGMSMRYYDDLPRVSIGDHTKYIATGTHYSSKFAQPWNYYDVPGMDNLNEILNETESLEMAEQKSYMLKRIGKNGNRFLLGNPESSNCDIANYGNMFKLILGSRNTFELMYLDCRNVYSKFNGLYNQIFQQAYGSNKDAIELFILAISKIKNEKREEDHLKLNEVLTNCLRLKIDHFFNSDSVTNETMLNTINQFEELIVKNENPMINSQLKHVELLNQLKSKVSKRNEGKTYKRDENNKSYGKSLFRRELDKSILDSIKLKIYNYLKENNIIYADEVMRRMNSLNGLFVENLTERQGSLMVNRGKENEIAIDVRFVRFDKSGNPICLDKNSSKLIENYLGHELIHAGSRLDGKAGIKYSENERELNEGFTQLIAENIFGYSVSINNDSYKNFKKYAKILEASFGKKCILESYFGKSKELQDRINALCPNYYDFINETLSNEGFLAHFKLSSNIGQLVTKSMILNIVIPILKKKSQEEANNYIKNMSLYFAEDLEFPVHFLSYLKEYLNADSPKLVIEKNRVENRIKRRNSKMQFIKECLKSKDIGSIIVIDDSGNVRSRDDRSIIISDSDSLTLIYDKICKQTYSKEELRCLESQILSDLCNGEKVEFGNKVKGDIKYKRSIVALFKQIARKNNFIVTNDLNTIKDDDFVDLDVINLNDNKDKFSFERLRDYSENYSILYDKSYPNYDHDSYYDFVIIDKKSGNKVENYQVFNGVAFAHLWVSAFKHTNDEPFGESAERIYNVMCDFIQEGMKENGTFDVDELYDKLMKEERYSLSSEILSQMFNSPYETLKVFRYFASLIPNKERRLETETTKVYNHTNRNFHGYVEMLVDELIPSKNKTVYNDLLNELDDNNISYIGKVRDNNYYYRLFISVADNLASAISVDNDILIHQANDRLDFVDSKIKKEKITKLDWNLATIDQKIQYCLANMRNSLKRRDINSYNFYRDEYTSVVNGVTNGLGKTS